MTMTQNELNAILKAHKKWINGEEGGRRADLWSVNFRGADLQDANLRGANLQGADIDYACWPLWCGSLDVRVDRRIFCQLAYHLCRVIVDDEDCKEAQLMLGRLANEFHRIDECGRVPENNSNPLALDELRAMDGEPIWCRSLLNGHGEWGICKITEMSASWYIAISGVRSAYGGKDAYGKTWLAYKAKPKEE